MECQVSINTCSCSTRPLSLLIKGTFTIALLLSRSCYHRSTDVMVLALLKSVCAERCPKKLQTLKVHVKSDGTTRSWVHFSPPISFAVGVVPNWRRPLLRDRPLILAPPPPSPHPQLSHPWTLVLQRQQ